MLLNILNEISQYLKSAVPEAQLVTRYKNEFEEKGNWTFVFPCMLYRVADIIPTAFFSNGEVAKRNILIKLFVADNNTTEDSVLQIIQKICDASNGKHLSCENFSISFTAGNINFHSYKNGVEVYILDLSIEYWKD